MPEIQLMDSGRMWVTLSFEATSLAGEGGSLYPCLKLPAKATLLGTQPDSFLLESLGGAASLSENPDTKIADVPYTPIFAVNFPCGLSLPIPLSPRQIEAIEEFRRGRDAEFILNIWGVIATGGRRFLASGRTALQIPKSLWAERVLPQVGYQAMKCIELPLPDTPMGKVFQRASAELEKAVRSYFADYEDSVADCRKALEPLAELVRPTSDAKAEEAGLRSKLKLLVQQLKPTLGDSTADSLGKIVQAMYDLFSKPHHESPPYHRHDAMLALHFTSSLLSYLGHAMAHGSTERT